MKDKSTEALVADFRAIAVMHGRALLEGETDPCNRAYDQLTRIRRELQARGDEHRRRLLELLDDIDPAVRNCAAVDALALAPDDGVRVLRDVAAGPPSVIRLDAEMMLELWNAGEWDTAIPS